MPKKGGKGKKGKKGKKGGGKSKKDASIKSMSEANSKLWEMRLEMATKVQEEYRDNSRRLVLENESLATQMQQTEKDTIDVVTYLKRQDLEKDKQIEKVVQQMKDVKKENRKEQERIVEDFQLQLTDVESKLAQKTHEAEVLQTELKMVKDFRRKRAMMQRELEEIKETMFAANQEHKETLARMEQRFFEEKMRLQQEANQRIAELAEKAHTEAIANLGEATRSVYKENVRVSEALNIHMIEEDNLNQDRRRLQEANKELEAENELNQLVIKDKVAEAARQKKAFKELQEKVETLEQSLSHVVREFEVERKALVEKARVENNSAMNEITKLQRTVDLKTKEMNKVKRLARNILEQRTQIECFFLESLEQVKKEIAANRAQYRKDAQTVFTQKMVEAHKGTGEYPKIRTFGKNEISTNSVFKDLEAAERLGDAPGRIEISDLTWEQKEKVLRHLFAKMNTSSASRRQKSIHSSLTSLSEKPSSPDVAVEDHTFLTNATVVTSDQHLDKLPSIAQSALPPQADPVS